jgi:hypothetical protein
MNSILFNLGRIAKATAISDRLISKICELIYDLLASPQTYDRGREGLPEEKLPGDSAFESNHHCNH